MEIMFKIFEWCSNTEGTLAFLFRWIGIQKLASWVLSRRGAVLVSGFKFFPQRTELTRSHGTLGDRLAEVYYADAIWVIGAKFYNDRINTHLVKRLILPDPGSNSFNFYANSVDQGSADEDIKNTTKRARKAGAKVRWCKEVLGQSIVLADTNRESGWVHVEAVLPYTGSE